MVITCSRQIGPWTVGARTVEPQVSKVEVPIVRPKKSGQLCPWGLTVWAQFAMNRKYRFDDKGNLGSGLTH